ncbi:hypothetical protein BVRB_021980, partial [Beta vulgaris subsp. vulgaris]
MNKTRNGMYGAFILMEKSQSVPISTGPRLLLTQANV